jgi:amidase
MHELATHSASELALLIRSRALSSRELLDFYLERIDRYNAALNAVVTLDVERARAAATALDEQLVTSGPKGPLHGLPITIKDAYETAGLRSTSGAKPWADYVPTGNAVTVQRLIDAGAVVFGKTNVPAYCADVQSFNDIFGVTNNPHDLARTPGGSSGGAAVAVACGFTAFELGSDIGGSIRTPANWTGVFGHKPTYGIVPQRGHLPPGPGAHAATDLSVCGPLARSAQDLALVLEVIAGPEAAQARAYRLELPKARHTSLHDYRIAVWLDDAAFPVDGEVARVLDDAVRALEAAGASVDRSGRPAPTLAETFDIYYQLLNPAVASGMPDATLDRLARLGHAGESVQLARFARTSTARHTSWLRAHEQREAQRARYADFFERFDVLLCPVSGTAAIPHNPEGSVVTRTIAIGGEPRPYTDLFGWISIATSNYLPASVVPVGRTTAGLPVGIQVIGPYLEDHTAIDFAGRVAELIGGFVPPHAPAA